MQVKQVMTRAIATCQPFDKLLDSACILEREGVGCLPVLAADGSERVVGMLNDRDVALIAARNDRSSLAEMQVRSAMTGAPSPLSPDDSLRGALEAMRFHGVRRAPVIDRKERLVGLLSVSDVADAVASGKEASAVACRSEICRILAKSAEARNPPPLHEDAPAAVDEIMASNVVTCRPDETVGAVGHRMDEAEVHCTPVLATGDQKRLAAMLTDRDVFTAAVNRAPRLAEIPVAEAMSQVVRTCWPDDSPEAAGAIMRAYGVRRLPVVDASDELLGLITLADLARTCLHHGTIHQGSLPCEEITDTLVAIARVARERSLPGAGSGDDSSRFADR